MGLWPLSESLPDSAPKILDLELIEIKRYGKIVLYCDKSCDRYKQVPGKVCDIRQLFITA